MGLRTFLAVLLWPFVIFLLAGLLALILQLQAPYMTALCAGVASLVPFFTMGLLMSSDNKVELGETANQDEQPTTGKHVSGLTIFEDGKPIGESIALTFKAPETPNGGYYDESEYNNIPSFSSPGFTTRYEYPFGLPVVVAVTNTFEDDVALDIYETVCLFNSINTTISEGGFSGEMDFGEGVSATWSLIAGDEELTGETADIEYLQALLSKAEAEQDFERAAQLRDQINALKND